NLCINMLIIDMRTSVRLNSDSPSIPLRRITSTLCELTQNMKHKYVLYFIHIKLVIGLIKNENACALMNKVIATSIWFLIDSRFTGLHQS
ncbi:hypothetical protein Avbf_18391, partial [Armadillidium vulgare]